MSEDLRLKLPFTCIISGPSVSGKSSFCIKLLQNFESLDTESKFDGGILWCYVEKNAVPLSSRKNYTVSGRHARQSYEPWM